MLNSRGKHRPAKLVMSKNGSETCEIIYNSNAVRDNTY